MTRVEIFPEITSVKRPDVDVIDDGFEGALVRGGIETRWNAGRSPMRVQSINR